MAENFSRWDVVELLKTDEDIKLYFEVCAEEDELLSNLVYRESSGYLFSISILFNAVNEFDALHNIR